MNGSIPRDAEGRALERQEILLLLIEQACHDDRYFSLRQFWESQTVTLVIGHESFGISVGGSGDSSSLRALVRKGHIEEIRSDRDSRTKFGYRITEDGKRRAQEVV